MTSAHTAQRVLTITREFDAPREKVFKAWAEPEIIARWWGPKGYSVPFCTVDFRVGGTWRYCMRSPQKIDIWCAGMYNEIDQPKKIVSTDYFCDKQGNKISPTQLGMPEGIPDEMILTITFEELGKRTRLTVTQNLPEDVAENIGAFDGWNESFDRLAAELASANHS